MKTKVLHLTTSLLLLLPHLSLGGLPTVEKGKPLPSDLFIELAKLVNPAVVNINTSTTPKQMQQSPQLQDPFFDFFRPFMIPQDRMPMQSLGTGFIIRKDGLIITNNHVIDQADIIKVQVLVSSEKEESFEAEVIGKDSRTDIALIKISGDKPFATIEMGESKNLEVGEWVAAFGNPFGHGHTMTKGIISAIGREIDELNRFPFLQTDASINPGNSGGPLVNVRGQVIGVNTAVDRRAQGIGFAIPIDNVKGIISTLEKEGHIKRGFLGVALANLVDQRAMEYLKLKSLKGALVEHVYEKTPAEKGGLKPYDFIVRVDKTAVESAGDLVRAISDTQVGQKVEIEFFREGKKKTTSVKIEEHPDEKNKPQLNKGIKKYYGQKAPYDLGFKVTDYNQDLRSEFDLPNLKVKRPVVISVEQGSVASRAGLAPGDIILEINKKAVHKTRDVFDRLDKKFNVVRVLRGDRAVLLYFET